MAYVVDASSLIEAKDRYYGFDFCPAWVQGENFRPQAKTQFLGGADPFLIAYAVAHGHTVVTDEILIPGELKRVKIPAVCQQFAVPCTSPFEMLRAEGARLVLR